MATFILVHGTWAKAAHWPALQDGLAEVARRADDEPVFERLPWTGRNRASSRQAASSAIFTLVRKIQRASINEKIFIIGHSHGGSAIAYFLKQYPEMGRTLAGCAFLSTPFVAIRPRKNAFRLILLLSLFPYFALFAWLATGIVRHRNRTLAQIEESLNTTSILDRISSYWLLWVVAALVCLALALIKRASAPQKVEQSVRQQTADLPDGSYLFLRCSGDEAAAGLSALQIVAWASMKTSKLLELLTRPLFNFERPFVQAVSFVIFSSVLSPLVGNALLHVRPSLCKSWLRYFPSFEGPSFEKLDFLRKIERIFDVVLPYASLIAAAAVFLCIFVALLIFVTQAVTAWVFGWMRLATGFLVELAIEPLPFGEHSLVHIDWTDNSIGLAHSSTYAHPTAIAQLQNWIRARLRGPETAAEPTIARP